MRTVIVALAIVLASGSAYAQNYGVGGVPQTMDAQKRNPQQAEAAKKERAESERAYKKALDSIPDTNKRYDPWQNVRP